MASISTFRLPHYDSTPLYIALYKDVTNAAFLRQQLLSANPAFDYAFLDATMIVSAKHLFLAALLALHSSLQNTLKTRTPHSELVFRLHPNNNIGESYRKFGISDDSKCIIAVKLGLSPDVTAESVASHLGEAVQGTSVEIGLDGEELGAWADGAKIRKVYKVNDVGQGKKKGSAVNGAAEDESERLETVILGIMSLKGS